MTAEEFCRLLAQQYTTKLDDHVGSIGDFDYPERDPVKMTIYTLPQFAADISITVGELRDMGGLARKS